MKKFITILSIFLFLSLTMNITKATADTKNFTQGIYNMSDSKLLTSVNYNV